MSNDRVRENENAFSLDNATAPQQRSNNASPLPSLPAQQQQQQRSTTRTTTPFTIGHEDRFGMPSLASGGMSGAGGMLMGREAFEERSARSSAAAASAAAAPIWSPHLPHPRISHIGPVVNGVDIGGE